MKKDEFENDLKELQNALLTTMEEIDKICCEENIKYYILGGTFIGAVRHKGFIPWDDDIDIAMDRKDYDKFLNVIERKLPANLVLDYYKNNDSNVHWIKIKNIDYKIVEKMDNIETEQNLFIDIFPFDNVPDGYMKRKIFKIQIFLKSIKLRLALMKYLKEKNKNDFDSKIKKIITKIISNKFFDKYLNQTKVLEQYDNLISKYKNTGTKMIANLCVNYKFNKIYRELFERNKISEVIDYNFENTKLKGIKNYDYLLSKTFGDYMKLPPEEERIAKHFIRLIKLNK